MRMRLVGEAALLFVASAFCAACGATEPDDSRSGADTRAGAAAPRATGGEAARMPADVSTQSATVSAPFDLSAVIRQVRFAYHPDADHWSAGHATYSVKADAGGLMITPRHYPEAAACATPVQPHSSTTRSASVSSAAAVGQPVTIQLLSISRGEQELATPDGVAQVEQDGSLAISRGPVVEHLRNSEDGVEQSWSFAQRPATSGDLVVRLQVSGHEFVGETPSGLHFQDPDTGIGVRYGNATWIDADYNCTHVPARYHEGEIQLSVSARVLGGSSYPALLDPVISPELGMDDPVLVPASTSQIEPAVASNGTHYLVVWSDLRPDQFGGREIYGTRVAADGVVVDPAGIAIGAADGHQEAPAVASDGTDFFVVWQDFRNSGHYDIYGARVDDAGFLLDPAGFLICNVGDDQRNPDLAFDGTNYLVVWEDGRAGGSNDVFGARVTPDAAVLDPLGVSIAAAASNESSPAIAYDGGNYLVIWTDGTSNDLFGRRVDTLGDIVDVGALSISRAAGSQLHPDVAFDGTNYVAVWEDNRSGLNYDIRGARINTAGNVFDPAGLPISTPAGDQNTPAILFDGTNYLVAWKDDRNGEAEIYGARVSTGGVVLDVVGFVICNASGVQGAPAVAFGGSNTLVAWHDERSKSLGTSDDIYGARVTTSGTVLDGSGTVLSTHANRQRAPAVAHDGTNYFVVWADHRDYVTTNTDVYGVRIAESGMIVDPSGIEISAAPEAQSSPDVAFNGTEYFVVWTDERSGSDYDIYGARVTTDGGVLDPGGVEISTADRDQWAPAVASDGTDYLVVWHDERDAASGEDIYAARVSAAGVTLDDGGIEVCAEAGYQGYADVAYGSGEYLVVWHDRRTATDYDVYAARVAPSGALLDPMAIAVEDGPDSQSAASVAHDGTNFLVAYSDSSSALTGVDIIGKRVSPDGAVLDSPGIAISDAPGAQSTPSVGFNGRYHVVAWIDERNGTDTDVFAVRIRQDGSVLEPSGIQIATTTDPISVDVVAPFLARAMLVYYRRDHDSPFSDLRVRGRFINWSVLAEPCSEDAECASGYCVDEVCCNTACGEGALTDCVACSVAAGAQLDGTCAAIDDGISCDDGLFCTGAGTCRDGSCLGLGDPCPGPDGDDDCAESCDDDADTCTGNDPDESPCPGGTCQAGVCQPSGEAGAGGEPGAGGAAGEAGAGVAGVGGSGGSATGAAAGTSAGGSAATGGSVATGAQAGSPPDRVCDPGRQVTCPCLGGGEGVQICNEEGSGYEPCTGCPTLDAGPGGRAGEAGSSGLVGYARDEDGCGCRVAGSPRHSRGLGALGAMLALGLLFRRRQQDRRCARAPLRSESRTQASFRV